VRKELSFMLISLLLLLSPLSFSSARIPDFTPDCSVAYVYALGIAVAPLDGATYDRIFLPKNKQVFTIRPTTILTDDWQKTTLFGRAPPA
jgi:hypothetical protein